MKFNNRNIILLLFIFLFIFIYGCQKKDVSEYEPQYSDNPPLHKKTVYMFGVHPLHNPKLLFEVYQPMLNYINARLKNSKLRLEASRNYGAYEKKTFFRLFSLCVAKSLSNNYVNPTWI